MSTDDLFLDRSIKTLLVKFGEKAVSEDFKKLLKQEKSMMRQSDFQHIVSILVHSKTIKGSELTQGFFKIRDWVKNKKNNPSSETGLRSVLEKDYPGCKNLLEAFEQAKIRQIKPKPV